MEGSFRVQDFDVVVHNGTPYPEVILEAREQALRHLNDGERLVSVNLGKTGTAMRGNDELMTWQATLTARMAPT
jgi:hypothetical protein